MSRSSLWYDGLLAAMPASVAGGAAAGWTFAVPLSVGAGIGSLFAGALLALSLVVAPPS